MDGMKRGYTSQARGRFGIVAVKKCKSTMNEILFSSDLRRRFSKIN